ncbi:TBC1 domain family member 10A-like [Stegostoma tigrinum]|uniref:TBC1 domain family member 10A-like n=1 Tax=Stegostoma tigrinum TaxID=3053191 RepID=UPI002870AC8E|nr:TBC1 domain family member 10A-like [Stegostoma tigrinum]
MRPFSPFPGLLHRGTAGGHSAPSPACYTGEQQEAIQPLPQPVTQGNSRRPFSPFPSLLHRGTAGGHSAPSPACYTGGQQEAIQPLRYISGRLGLIYMVVFYLTFPSVSLCSQWRARTLTSGYEAMAWASQSKRSLQDTESLNSAMEELTDTLNTRLDLNADDGSSIGSDSEINGAPAYRQTDKYGFIGGSQFTGESEEVSTEVLRQREMKWIDMTKNWDKWITRKYKKVQLRCRKGIPASVRAAGWPTLCAAYIKKQENKGVYQRLVQAPGDRQWLDAIEKDLHRQFPFHEMFVSREGNGQRDLCNILKAYSVYKPEEGYCQAQGPIAAVLLMHMPAEDAFWCLVQICELYVPGYYSQGLEAVQLDGQVLFSLLRKVSTVAYRHLKKHQVDPLIYMTEWFMCLFSRTLPWATVLRVWDMFFCEGVKVIFRVALVLLKVSLGSSDKLKDCQGLVETLEKLRSIPPRFLQEDFIIHQVSELTITQRDIEQECSRQLKKWRKRKGAAVGTANARVRLYGARQVHDCRLPAQAGPQPWQEELAAARGLPAIVISKPQEERPRKEPQAGDLSRSKPAARSRTFYVQRRHKPPPVPTRGISQNSVQETHRPKRNSEPLISDTYF